MSIFMLNSTPMQMQIQDTEPILGALQSRSCHMAPCMPRC